MVPKRKKTLVAICLVVAGVSVAAGLILTAFEKNLMYFYSPSEISEGEAPDNRPFRIGGLVKENSVMRQPSGLGVWFTLTDLKENKQCTMRASCPTYFERTKGL